jgi:dTDP-4-dehydrorhamnose reductase
MPKKKDNIVIIGANGQLGHDVAEVFSDRPHVALMGAPEKDIDITDIKSVSRALKKKDIGFVINCAAYTNVPQSEEKKELAYGVNALGPKNVAEACREKGIFLIHISTDYVFDGKKGDPYEEYDIPSPLNYYGFTKAEGEKFVEKTANSYYIIRTSGLYGTASCLMKGENFADKMIRFYNEGREIKVVDDEYLTPTHTLSLARQIRLMTEKKPASGIYHATNEGSCSWYEYAREIFLLLGLPAKLQAVKRGDFAAAVQRPAYSVLENRKLKQAGINIMEDWRDALKEYLKIRKYPVK